MKPFSLKQAHYTLIIFSKCKNRLSTENCAVFLTDPDFRAEPHFKQVHSCIIKKSQDLLANSWFYCSGRALVGG